MVPWITRIMIIIKCNHVVKMSLDPRNAQGVVPLPPVAYQREWEASGRRAGVSDKEKPF
tara:strand:- start:2010 stop:2186 length:177 start_codon:yes stop_codon:yes gene_type:complete